MDPADPNYMRVVLCRGPLSQYMEEEDDDE